MSSASRSREDDSTGSVAVFEVIVPGAERLAAPAHSHEHYDETVYGVADAATLDRIGGELSKDREVKLGADGVVRAFDDMGFALAFQGAVSL